MTSDDAGRPQKGSYAWQKQQYESRERSEATRERVAAKARENERNPQQSRENNTRESKADRWLGYTPEENRGASTRDIPAQGRDREIER